MNYYVSAENVRSSIEYFKSSTFDKDAMLFLFLMNKHLGVTTTYPVTYLTGGLSDAQKEERLRLMWMLGGLFDGTETCNDRGLMFPSAFRDLSYYQPGTKFSGVVTSMNANLKVSHFGSKR